MSEFLTVFENNFVPNADLKQKQNDKQNVCGGVYSNDFIKFNLAQDILKRVLMNGMTGSSWRFKMFDRICLAVNSDEIGSVGK